MATVLAALTLCAVCSLVLRAPMVTLYILAWLLGVAAFLVVGYLSPTLLTLILIGGFSISLINRLDRR